jgi:hypothetical protein
MEARLTETICAKSKVGHSLTQISELTGLTLDEVRERIGQATGLSPEALSDILHMKQRGLTLELISQESDVELEVLKQFLPQAIKKTVEAQIDTLADQGPGPYEISLGERAYALGSPDHSNFYTPTKTEKTKQPPQPTKTLAKPQDIPTFLYSCEQYTNKLHKVNLLTGMQSFHVVPSYQFRYGCRWSELPGGSLLITGGYPAGTYVEKIDALREYAVSSLPPMHTPRQNHAAVFHSQYLYVLGGFLKGRVLSKCERYSCAKSQWEVLSDLPVAAELMSAVENASMNTA